MLCSMAVPSVKPISLLLEGAWQPEGTFKKAAQLPGLRLPLLPQLGCPEPGTLRWVLREKGRWRW